MKKRILSLLLCAAMMVSMVVFSGAASEEDAPELTAAETLAPTETADPTATPESTETAEPTVTPAPTETAEPTATPESTETAEPTATPAPTETAEPTATPAPTADPESGETPVNRWGTFTVDTITLHTTPNDSNCIAPDTLPERFFVLSSCTAADGTEWYRLDTAEWDWNDDNKVYCYVEAQYVTLDEEPEATPTPAPTPEAGTVTTLEDDATGVTVSGENIPEGVTLSVTDVSAEEEYANSAMALDITLTDGDGNEWQPSSAGTYVAVTLDVSKNGWDDGTIVTLTHIHDGTSTDYLYVVIDQKLTFYTDSFSIYEVSEAHKEPEKNATSLDPSETYGMTVGGSQTFYWTNEKKDSGTVLGIVWSVSDSNNSVTYTVHANGYNANKDQKYWVWNAPWITVNARRATAPEKPVVVTATIYYSNGNTDTEHFNITVQNDTGKFHIEDKIAESGCLVPVWPEGTDTTGYTYTWKRSDGNSIRPEALVTNDDGTVGVNVSLDSGGVDINENGTTTEPITYTVTAKAADGSEQTASFKVTYGQRILNPSFETPDLPDGVSQRQYPNGYEGLYWKTTAPGAGNKLGLDVEIGSKNDGNPYYITATPDEGSQFAELNSEEIGTLYQDMLTTSNATLKWEFSHAARYDNNGNTTGATTMYIIIGATKDAQSIIDAGDISDLISAAKRRAGTQGISIASADGGNGFQFTYNNGNGNGTYCIWMHTASNNKENPWSKISGSYTVPEGQYLTRLFFASDPDTADNKTLGNLIDGVDAGQTMSYQIEFYLNGSDTADKTLSGTGTVYKTVEAKNIQDYLKNNSDYVITSVKVNGKDYSGDIKNGLYITDYGEKTAGQNVDILVKVYLEKKVIAVEKKVEIDGWSSLTTAEKEKLLKDYSVTMELSNSSGKSVSTLTLTAESIADGTVTLRGKFNATLTNGTYTVKETSYTTPTGYKLESTTYTYGSTTYTYKVGNSETTTDQGVSVTIDTNNPTAAVTVTNDYKIAYADLTIKKTVSDSTPDQSFVFNIIGEGKTITVVFAPTDFTNGTATKTISGLRVGETYTVAEDTSWSWRYEPTDGKSKAVTITADSTKNTVTFENTRNNNKWLDGNAFAVNTYNNTTTSTNG